MSNPFHASLTSDSDGITYAAGELGSESCDTNRTKHHEVGALKSALSEPISLIPSPLPGCLCLSQATDNADGAGGGKSQSTFGFNRALPLLRYMVLGNLCNIAEPVLPDP